MSKSSAAARIADTKKRLAAARQAYDVALGRDWAKAREIRAEILELQTDLDGETL
jgi:hypothetical protein